MMKRLSVTLFFLSFALAVLTLPVYAQVNAQVYAQVNAAAYPSRPVTLIVPFAPGASTDIETRLYARKLAENTGRAFIADYKPGAGTTIGTAYVAKSAPDGYTLLSFTSGFAGSAAIYKTLPYDPYKDFSPIALMSNRTVVLVSPATAPFKNLAEYIAYTRARPGEINVATPGLGSGPHLNMAWLHGLLNTRVTYIHYKGSAPANMDLLAGRVHVMATALTASLANIRAGKLRAFAIGNALRSPLLPDLQTVIEQGVPGYDYSSPFGFVGPAGMPPALVSRINAELVKVAKSPDIIKTVEADGGMLVTSTPEQLRQKIVKDITLLKKIVQDTGIALEE